MLNEFNVIGRLTQDIELRYTQGGTAVGNFSLAINEKWTDKNSGEAKENVVFPRFDIWGSSAENMTKLTAKGSLVFVKSKYAPQSWEDKEGQKRIDHRFRVMTFQVLNGFKDGAIPKTEPQQLGKKKEQVPTYNPTSLEVDDEDLDIPF